MNDNRDNFRRVLWLSIGVFIGLLLACHLMSMAICGWDEQCAFEAEAGR